MRTTRSIDPELRRRLIIPLDDLATMEALRERTELLAPVAGMFKIGKGSYTRFGLEAIRAVQDAGADVFLDLKYHDIPNTVSDAVHAAADNGVQLLNVHASGGRPMMEAAAKARDESGADLDVIAVTVLTSLSEGDLASTYRSLLGLDHGTMLYEGNRITEQTLQNMTRNIVSRASLDSNLQRLYSRADDGLKSRFAETLATDLALDAYESGLDGVVCSPHEASGIKEAVGRKRFIAVTPGIKGPHTQAGADQARVATPSYAIARGADQLVVGRAITNAEDPVEAAYAVLEDIERGLQERTG